MRHTVHSTSEKYQQVTFHPIQTIPTSTHWILLCCRRWYLLLVNRFSETKNFWKGRHILNGKFNHTPYQQRGFLAVPTEFTNLSDQGHLLDQETIMSSQQQQQNNNNNDSSFSSSNTEDYNDADERRRRIYKNRSR